jgi:hypothetical protein
LNSTGARWIDGDGGQDAFMSVRGANACGTLSEVVVSDEQRLVEIPAKIDVTALTQECSILRSENVRVTPKVRKSPSKIRSRAR